MAEYTIIHHAYMSQVRNAVSSLPLDPRALLILSNKIHSKKPSVKTNPHTRPLEKESITLTVSGTVVQQKQQVQEPMNAKLL